MRVHSRSPLTTCTACVLQVITLEGVAHGYKKATLFKDIDLCIERGDRIAILGANGAGKSTLLRLIMGREQPREGHAEIVAQNAVTEFFEQDQANVLPLEKTVMQTMEHAGGCTCAASPQRGPASPQLAAPAVCSPSLHACECAAHTVCHLADAHCHSRVCVCVRLRQPPRLTGCTRSCARSSAVSCSRRTR